MASFMDILNKSFENKKENKYDYEILSNDYVFSQRILNSLEKDFIDKWKTKENEINNKLDCIKGENDLSIKKIDNSEAYSLVEKQEQIQSFLEDLHGLKNFIEDQERIYLKENEEDKKKLLQIDARTGELKEVSSVVDDIKLIAKTYLNSCDNINANNDFGNGMRTAYKIILDYIIYKDV